MENQPPEIPADLQAKIDKFLANVRKKIDDANLEFSNSKESKNGSYHVSLNEEKNRFYIRVTDSQGRSYKNKFDIIFNKNKVNDDNSANYLLESIKKMLSKEYGLLHLQITQEGRAQTIGDEQLDMIIEQNLEKIRQKFPEDFSFSKDSQEKYLCTIQIINPYTYRKGYALSVRLRPYSDIDSAGEQYKKDVSFEIALGDIGTQGAQQAKNKVLEYLGNYNITEHKIRSRKKDAAEIPKEFIDEKDVRVSYSNERSGKPFLVLHLMPSKAEFRLSSIETKFSNISGDLGMAGDKILDYVKSDLISSYKNGDNIDKPLILKNIRQDIEAHFPELFLQRKQQDKPRFDQRAITLGGEQICQLFTPSINGETLSCLINIAPRVAGKNPAHRSGIKIPINTADQQIQYSRTCALQSLTRIVLEDYFKEHADKDIVIEQITKRRNGKNTTFNAFRRKQPAETAPQGKVFFEDLREGVLKPAYEQFNRYIYWETKVEQEDDGKYKITAQIKRNEKAEEFPANDSIMGRVWEFRAKDEKQAMEFSHKLEENILRKEHLFSRERPVEHFGVSSMRVVARESLLEAIVEAQGIEDLQPHLTKFLKPRTENR